MEAIVTLAAAVITAAATIAAALVARPRRERSVPQTAKDEFLTPGEAARRLGVETWQVQRVYERGLLPEPRRLGRYRVIAAAELPALAEACKKGGYLK